MPSRLELYENNYEQFVGDPTNKQVNWKPQHKKDDVVLTFREYNDMLTKIYYLEGKTRWLESVNKHLGEEVQSLQNQLLSRKLRKVRCICKLRGKCQ